MGIIRSAVGAFDRQSARDKARWIAAMCAVLGVFTGFVLYIVFTHSFEKGDLEIKLIGLGLGLLIAIVLARVAEWLWHTIDTGHAEIGQAFSKTASTAILLVVVFELCVSAFEDFTKAAIGDYAAIQEIAANVAGQKGESALTDENANFQGLFDALAGAVTNDPAMAGSTGPGAVLSRLAGFLGTKDRVLLFQGPIPQNEMDRLWATLSFDPAATSVFALGLADQRPVWEVTCKGAMPPGPTTLGIGMPLNNSLSTQPQRMEWERICREALGAVTREERLAAVSRGINFILARHDFYDPVSFARQRADGSALLAPDDVLAIRAMDQRSRCDQIRGRPASPGSESFAFNCVSILSNDQEKAKSLPHLIQTGSMRQLNREILARVLPEYVKASPIHWGDFAMLVLVWCIAAMVLAVLLSDTVFKVAREGPVLEALKPAWTSAAWAIFLAALSLGLTVVAIRLVAFVWDLMFAPAVPVESIWDDGLLWSVLSSFPAFVNWLKSGDLLGLVIPGWVTVPVVIVGATSVALMAKDDNPLKMFASYGLLGLFILSVGPVFEGLFGLMVLVAVTWAVPAFGLATLLPYLEPGAALPRWWGFIAFGAGALLAIWALLAMEDGDALTRGVLAASAIGFVVLGVLILRQHPLREAWPLVAVTVMMTFMGAASVVQQATFQGALNQLHPLTSGEVAPEGRGPFDYLFFSVQERLEGPQVPADSVLEVPQDAARQAGHLELALVGSLGFWLTISLLVAWSLRRTQEKHAPDAPIAELSPSPAT